MRSNSVYMITSAVLLLLLSWTISANPTEIVLGQSAPYSGGVWEPAAPFNRGMLAAFYAANQNGGVNNRTIRLISLDDAYTVANTSANVKTLLSDPTVFVLVGLMGSGTTTAGVSVATPQMMPVIGPMTGSAVFRRTFNPYVINIRAGYDDEALTMLRLLIEVKFFKRIAMIYQDDSFGIPSMQVVVAAMTYMGMSLTSLTKYTKALIPTINYTAIASDVIASNPQAIIMYAVSGFANPFLTKYYSIGGSTSTVLTFGSWIGDEVRDYIKRVGYDPTFIYTTQVVPHPRSSTSALSQNYRAAYDTYMQLQNQSLVGAYDYFSVEGYVVGRVMLEMLERMGAGTPSRTAFLDAVYETRMFRVDDMILGPFSRDCQFPQSAVGRSSMCNCTQGLRFVSTTVFDSTYSYQLAAPDLVYSMSECWMPTSVLRRPTQGGVPTLAVAPRGVAALGAGFSSHPSLGAASLANINSTSAVSVNANDVTKVGASTYLSFIFGLSPVDSQNDFMVLSGMSGGSVHTGVSVPLLSGGVNGAVGVRLLRREQLFVLPTVEQEVDALCAVLQHSGFSLVRLIFSSSLLLDVAKPLRMSAVTRGMTLSLETYTSDADLQARLSGHKDTHTAVVVAGVDSAATMNAALSGVATAVAGFPDVLFAFLGCEVSSAWDGVPTSGSHLGRVIFGTSLPLWTNATTSSFSAAYQAALAQQTVAARANPNTAVGFLSAGLLAYLQTRATSLQPRVILDTAYQFGIASVADVTLGPFVDVFSCAAGNQDVIGAIPSSCGCNSGVRKVYFHSLLSVLTGAPTTAITVNTVTSELCFPSYTAVEPVSMLAVTVIAVVIPCVAVIVAVVFGCLRYREWKRLSHAPKDSTKPIYSLFVTLKKESSLWDRYPAAMPHVLDRFSRIVNGVVVVAECYRVKDIGSAILIVATTPERVLDCAAALLKSLERVNWTEKYLANAKVDNADFQDTSTVVSHGRMSVVSSEGAIKFDDESLSHNAQTSMACDVTSSKSLTKNASHRRKAPTMKAEKLVVEFGISVHCDVGRIQHLEERKAFDYSGPAIDGAARLSDMTAGGQILTTQAVKQNAEGQSSQFKTFSTVSLGARETTVLQYTPPGATERTFSAPNEDENDGLAAALEQQAVGVTSKKVTVATLHIERIQGLTVEEAAAVYQTILSRVYNCVKEAKGFIHSVVGPRIVVSFNSVTPTPQALRRIHHLVDALSEALMDDVSCGVATESTLVGMFDVPDLTAKGNAKVRHAALMSKVGEISGAVLNHALRRGIRFTALSSSAEELEMFARIQYCDVVQIPGFAKPLGLLAVHGLKGGDADEWMYELESGAKTDPYAAVNRMYDKVLRGGAAGMIEAEALMKEFQPTDIVPESAVQPLRKLIAAASVEKYLETSVTSR